MIKRLICAIFGHDWIYDLRLDRYCARCGVWDGDLEDPPYQY